jgi:putative transposase
MAAKAVATHGGSISLVCRTFGVSQTCYRYSRTLNPENDQIADLLISLTKARKTWGFGLCFLYLRNVQGHGWNHMLLRLLGNHRRLLTSIRSQILQVPYPPRSGR